MNRAPRGVILVVATVFSMYWSVLSVTFIMATVEVLTQTRIPNEPLGLFIQDTITKFLFTLIIFVVMFYAALFALYMNIKVLIAAGFTGYLPNHASSSQNLRQRWLPIVGILAATAMDIRGFFPPSPLISLSVGTLIPIILCLMQVYLFVF